MTAIKSQREEGTKKDILINSLKVFLLIIF